MKYKIGDIFVEKANKFKKMKVEVVNNTGQYPYYCGFNNGYFSEDYLDDYYLRSITEVLKQL